MSTAAKSPAKNEKLVRTPAHARTHSQSKDPSTAVAGSLQSIQQSAGNLAIQQLLNSAVIRAKLSISQPHDPYEKEADRVAEQVMGMPGLISEKPTAVAGLAESLAPARTGDEEKLHLQTEEEEADEKPIQTKPLASQITPLIQRQAEEQPDIVATTPLAQRMAEPRQDEGEEETVSPKRRAGTDQPVPHEAEAEERPVQADRQTETSRRPTVGTDKVTQTIANKDSGSPMNPSTRETLESRMGADLSTARIHTDTAANEAASALSARAFTQGKDIYLARGESETNLGLMAHESTHVIQQGAVSVRPLARTLRPAAQIRTDESKPIHRQAMAADNAESKAAVKGDEDAAPGIVELKGQPSFPASPQLDEYLERQTKKTGNVRVRFGKMAEGTIQLRKRDAGKYHTVGKSVIPLIHPLFAHMGESASAFRPTLNLQVDAKGLVSGSIGIGAGQALTSSQLSKAPELLGLVGIDLPKVPTLPNRVEGGILYFGPVTLGITLGGAFSGSLTVEATDENIKTFEGKATVSAQGLATGDIELKRSREGIVTGRAVIGLALPKNITGNVDVAWDGQAITGEGKVGYQGEKLSGEMTLRLMEKGEAAKLEAEKKAPPKETSVPAARDEGSKRKGKKVKYVVFGEGDLTFAFTDWLNGTAHVIVDPKGFVTIIGKITPQKEFELFPQKDYNKDLFKLEARAAYGIPVVGNIFIFANVGMDAFAKVGPGRFYNIIVEGTYSTDPDKNKAFSVQGSFNISAAAGLRLRGEAGAGLEILDHDIKAGAGINGIAAIRGYAEATPTIGYREKGNPGEDKKGEFFIRGDLEIAAQPFLGLSGDLFVELDSPWWSPAPDKKWTWPLGGKEWPVGGEFGIGASVDYVFGSGQAPALEFKPVDFSADKFLTDLYSDKAKASGAGAAEQAAQWKEKNSKEAAPPEVGKQGNVQEGKAAAQPQVESTNKLGGETTKKKADPNDRTAGGKTVKEYQEEAAKTGKKPEVKEPEKGTAKVEGTPKDSAKETHDEQMKKGLAALDAVTQRYAQDGATKDEVVAGVKSVRRKFKVFESIEVIDGGETWDYEYVASPIDRKGGPKKKQEDKGASYESLRGKPVVKRTDAGDTLIEGMKVEGYIIQITDKKANIRRKSVKAKLPELYIDAEGKLTDEAPEGTKSRDLDQIARDYGAIADGLKVTVAAPKWDSPKTEKQLDEYRRNLRAAVAAEYQGKSLADLDTDVLSSRKIPAKYVKIRSEIFEEWVATHNQLVKRNPKPWFKSPTPDLLQKDRSADGYIEGTTTLVEVKSLAEARAPGTEEKGQIEDYGTIINEPVPWIVKAADGGTKHIIFKKVRYMFNRANIYDKWIKPMDDEIGKGNYEIWPPKNEGAKE